MNILLFKNHTVYSSKNLKQLQTAIDQNSETRRLLIDPNQKLKAFFGSHEGNNFKLSRATIKKNSFAPIAVGSIRESDNKTSIDVVLRLTWPVLIFTGIWVLFFVLTSFIFLFIEKNFMGLIPAAMLFLGFQMMNKAISVELIEIKKLLDKLLT